MSLAAQIAKTGKKKKLDWSFDCILSERQEQTFSPNWQGFKVFTQMWDNIVGCKFIIFFILVEMWAEQPVEAQLTWSSVSMTSAVMGFWLTPWGQTAYCAFLMMMLATNKNKA